MRSALLLLVACLPAFGADTDGGLSHDVTIKAKGAAGPPVRVPPPAADRAVLDEVQGSLEVLQAEHRPPAPETRVPAGGRRQGQPFPEAPFLGFSPKAFPGGYDRWLFEVYAGERLVFKAEGAGRPEERLAWDGSDAGGKMAARVGEAYHFRFTGIRGDEESVVASEPVELASLLYREALGDVHLEVANALLFGSGKPRLLDGGLPYLNALADRLRRTDPRERPFALTLYQKEPQSKLARRRAEALKKFFSRALLVHPDRVSVERRPVEDRGDALACRLPPDPGAVIGGD